MSQGKDAASSQKYEAAEEKFEDAHDVKATSESKAYADQAGDILIYSEPQNKVFLQGATATITNSLSILILGTILLKAYAATKVKKGSLRKD